MRTEPLSVRTQRAARFVPRAGARLAVAFVARVLSNIDVAALFMVNTNPQALVKKVLVDKVLELGWAYGKDGTALRGKTCLWVVTTGGDAHSYSPEGLHAHAIEAFTTPMRQTAALCGMRFVEPFVLHAAHRRSPASLEAAGRAYRERLIELTEAFDTETGLPVVTEASLPAEELGQ